MCVYACMQKLDRCSDGGNEWTGGVDGGIWCWGCVHKGWIDRRSMAIILDILMTAPGVETLKAHLLPLDYIVCN